MELLLDTGNVAKIRNAMEYYPVSGVTTNPTILRKEGDVPFWDLIGEIKELIGPQRSLHVQTISSDADGIIREAGIIAERLGMDTYIKIPVDREGAGRPCCYGWCFISCCVLQQDGEHLDRCR